MRDAREYWANVAPSRTTDCWLWTRGVSSHGYGKLTWAGRQELAHRVAYQLVNGPIAAKASKYETVVMHCCDNKLCCNPDHLTLGSQAENMADMKSKGRGRRPMKKQDSTK